MTTHNDLWKQDSLKLSATSMSLRTATSPCSCEEKATEVVPIHTYSTQICSHTHTCPLPLLQLYNLNATDSLAKTSRANHVIAVYFSMQRNSFIHYHVKLMASVSVEMNRNWEEIADRRCWSFLPALLSTVTPTPLKMHIPFVQAFEFILITCLALTAMSSVG